MPSPFNVTYTVSSESIKENLNGLLGETSKEKPIEDFFYGLKDVSFFDTGLLPLDGSGTLSIRQALGKMQVVFQHTPGIYRVIWGSSEGDPDAGIFDLAMPYRIVIGDFSDGEFYGARHFYSTSPITSKDQILFHVNLPNLNCKGYGGGNGVGWICLYHNKPSIKELDIGQKIANLIDRAGGGEAYNDGNMNETDGPRFYKEQFQLEATSDSSISINDYDFLWNPEAWEYKTQTEGFEWTLQPELWIPVQVENIDSQKKHTEGGEFLTLGMAMDGMYRAYYHDDSVPKAYQKYIRPDFTPPTGNDVLLAFKSTFSQCKTAEIVKEKPISNPIIPIPEIGFTCFECHITYDAKSFSAESHDGIVCELCLHILYELCASCDTYSHYSNLYYYQDNFHCAKCVNLHECIKCFSLFTNLNSSENVLCDACSQSVPKMDKSVVQTSYDHI